MRQYHTCDTYDLITASVATAKADVFRKNEITVGIKLVKIRENLLT